MKKIRKKIVAVLSVLLLTAFFPVPATAAGRDGEGFAEEDIPHLFERFYRGRNGGGGGIGFGLSLAKEIVERQNGTIRAKNKVEGGALFEIHFYGH